MNSVKCKTGNMAVRDYCLVWGCPGLVILTISLFVSLKVGNDFGQDNFAKLITFVISSGLLGMAGVSPNATSFDVRYGSSAFGNRLA